MCNLRFIRYYKAYQVKQCETVLTWGQVSPTIKHFSRKFLSEDILTKLRCVKNDSVTLRLKAGITETEYTFIARQRLSKEFPGGNEYVGNNRGIVEL
jgi:hypothetical protein